jgi:hypothetical protein
MEEIGIECWGNSKKKKTLNSLNETLEWEDGRDSLTVFLHTYGRKGLLSTTILYWAEMGRRKINLHPNSVNTPDALAVFQSLD